MPFITANELPPQHLTKDQLKQLPGYVPPFHRTASYAKGGAPGFTPLADPRGYLALGLTRVYTAPGEYHYV